MTPPSDKLTPPMGVILLFSELKNDLRQAVEADKKDHDSLRSELKDVRNLNEKQSRSLERIEGALGVKKVEASEGGKTRRKLIQVIGGILLAMGTTLAGYFLGK